MTIRKITSMTMLLSFVLLVLTSIILYIVPHGRVAYWSDWHLWGLTKTQWGNLHVNLGFLFLLSGFMHIFYNWKPLLAYMKNKSRKLKIFTLGFNIALALTIFVSIGTLFNIPPMSTIINFGEAIKEQAAEKYGEPPYGHAELSSLTLFAKRTGLDLTVVRQRLQQANIHFQKPQQSIIDIAEHNNITPKALFEIMKPALQKSAEGVSFPETPPPGFGRQVLSDICREYHLNTGKIIDDLAQHDIKAAPNQKIKEIASENQMTPHALFEHLQQAAKR
jgi:AraC-like DNA-binding protein